MSESFPTKKRLPRHSQLYVYCPHNQKRFVYDLVTIAIMQLLRYSICANNDIKVMIRSYFYFVVIRVFAPKRDPRNLGGQSPIFTTQASLSLPHKYLCHLLMYLMCDLLMYLCHLLMYLMCDLLMYLMCDLLMYLCHLLIYTYHHHHNLFQKGFVNWRSSVYLLESAQELFTFIGNVNIIVDVDINWSHHR